MNTFVQRHAALVAFAATFMLSAALLIVLHFLQAPVASGSTIASAVPKVATTSTVAVGPQQVMTLFATSSVCTGRAISTVASGVMLSFSGTLIPSASIGHGQLASTTVFYTNGDYGCGAVTAYAFSSTTITVTAFAQ